LKELYNITATKATTQSLRHIKKAAHDVNHVMHTLGCF